MRIDQDFINLGAVPLDLITPFAEFAKTVNWEHNDFTRHGDPLKSRTAIVRYNRRHEPYQPDTEQVRGVTNAFEPLNQWVQQQHPDHIFFKGEINSIKPGLILPFHVDCFWFHKHASRVHIPIITNSNSWWLAENRFIHLPVGSYYEVNNSILHSVWNNGTENRLHVVLDIMPKETYDRMIHESIDPNFFLPEESMMIDPAVILGEAYTKYRDSTQVDQ